MSKNNVLKLLILASIVGGTLFLALESHQPQAPEVGETAPDFTLPTLRGESISLREYRHGVVVVNFWATWCPPCIEETPSLTRFAEQMRGLGVTVVGVSVDQDVHALEKFVTGAQLTFPIARDPDQSVASRYGTFKFPESYIIDREGRIARKIVGAIDWQDPRVVGFVRNLAR
ncbi:MAG: peroxiredoxin family protein [Terriglobia bacterium]